MKNLPRDVKTILTKTAFNVPPHLMGRSLASPKRRLAALLIDLAIASTLATMMGLNLLFVIGVIFLLPVFFNSLKSRISKKSRVVLFFAGILLIVITLATISGKKLYQRFVRPLSTGNYESVEDSLKVRDLWTKIEQTAALDTSGESQAALRELQKVDVFKKLQPEALKTDSIQLVENFYRAYKQQDSAGIAQYRAPLQQLIAGEIIEQKDKQIEALSEKADRLEEELETARENLENPSFMRTAKAFVNDIGLSVGWTAFYFIFCWFLFDGKSPGKKLMHIQIIRMNGHDLKLWYCFERFSGYAAGLATGLLGFLQIYWDDNRQCIHDKIASTVVIDLKPKRK